LHPFPSAFVLALIGSRYSTASALFYRGAVFASSFLRQLRGTFYPFLGGRDLGVKALHALALKLSEEFLFLGLVSAEMQEEVLVVRAIFTTALAKQSVRHQTHWVVSDKPLAL